MLATRPLLQPLHDTSGAPGKSSLGPCDFSRPEFGKGVAMSSQRLPAPGSRKLITESKKNRTCYNVDSLWTSYWFLLDSTHSALAHAAGRL